MGGTLSQRRNDRTRCRLGLETLEARRLLASSPAPAPLSAFDKLIGATAARQTYHVDGQGYSVAVIDTGVNYGHEALGGSLSSTSKVLGGYDFADNNADPNAKTWQHGTAVAGLIASQDPAHLGVAPGANLVPLRVFGDDNQGDFNLVADALQWVVDNHKQYGITVVNLSISDGNNYTRNLFSNDGGVGQRIGALVSKLDALEIPVVTAAGNGFNGQQGMGFTAIVADTISVTATDPSDRFDPTAQRLGAGLGGDSATDLAAPGSGLVAPVEGNQFTSVEGTSFAAPQVAGAIVLLQEIYRSRFGQLPSVSEVSAWLKAGSDPIVDPITGVTVGRLDIPKAAALVPTPTIGSAASPAGSLLGIIANPSPSAPSTKPALPPVTPPAASAPAPRPINRRPVRVVLHAPQATHKITPSKPKVNVKAHAPAVRSRSLHTHR